MNGVRMIKIFHQIVVPLSAFPSQVYFLSCNLFQWYFNSTLNGFIKEYPKTKLFEIKEKSEMLFN